MSMRSSACSSPVSIPASEPIAINPRRRSGTGDNARSTLRHSGYSSSSSDDFEDRHRSSALSSAMERSDSLGDLRVGSLPMHLRRSGRSGRQRQLSGGTGFFFAPQSLPPPRAPFLSSRGGDEGNLSRIPDMVLPESAASADPELSSVPYGSLRESKFTHPGFGFERVSGQHPPATASTTFQPQSLPAYSGIGSYFNANNNNLSTSSHSGIGSLFEEAEGRQNQADSVCSGLSQFFDSGLQLNEQANDTHSQASSQATFQQPYRGRETNINESEPLSSSLTALDILTQIRQQSSSGVRSTLAPLDKKSLIDNSFIHQQQQQEQTNQARLLRQLSPLSNRFDDRPTPNSAHDDDGDDNEDHNPDTFEAFDFELDEC